MYEHSIQDHDEILQAERLMIDAIMDGDDTIAGLVKDAALRRVLEQARDDSAIAARALVVVDPFDAEAVRELQWKVSRYHMLCVYVIGILRTAEMYREQLTDEEAEALDGFIAEAEGGDGAHGQSGADTGIR